ncbi:MAG: AEC family transporter [Clostridia bacterium]|nr:AEC family transporter [Clostridia bacterium]
MQIVFKQLLVLYIFLFVGWLIGKAKREKASHADILSVLLVNVLLPCKVFSTFANNATPTYIREKYTLILAGAALLSVLALASYFLPKLLTKNKYERRVYAYSVPIANYAYLGYALIGSVFGEGVLADFMFFAIPFIFYTYTVGYVLLTGGDKPWKKLLNPITAAIVLGIAVGLSNIEMPSVISSAASMGAGCVGPLSMILTGITLSGFAMKDMLTDKTAYIFSAIRLIGIPAIAYLVCSVSGLDYFLPMILIITCMPCGLNTIVFPKLIGEDCKPGARLALITHVLALVTLPLWLSIIL